MWKCGEILLAFQVLHDICEGHDVSWVEKPLLQWGRIMELRNLILTCDMAIHLIYIDNYCHFLRGTIRKYPEPHAKKHSKNTTKEQPTPATSLKQSNNPQKLNINQQNLAPSPKPKRRTSGVSFPLGRRFGLRLEAWKKLRRPADSASSDVFDGLLFGGSLGA